MGGKNQTGSPNLAIHQNYLEYFPKIKIPGSHFKPAESESLGEEEKKPIFNKLLGDSFADTAWCEPAV
jgi:hypothetical protein